MAFIQAAFGALLVFFGGAIMCLELLASNLMAPYFGGSVYIWGSIISSIMVHLAVGYVLGGWLSKRSGRLSTLLLALAFASVWTVAIPWFQHPLCQALADGLADVRYGSLLAMNLIFFVPIMLMGMVSPYLIGLLGRVRAQSGLSAGVILFLSTFGSFWGANLTAFYFIDLWPVSRIVAGVGLIGLILAVAMSLLGLDRRLAELAQAAGLERAEGRSQRPPKVRGKR